MLEAHLERHVEVEGNGRKERNVMLGFTSTTAHRIVPTAQNVAR